MNEEAANRRANVPLRDQIARAGSALLGRSWLRLAAIGLVALIFAYIGVRAVSGVRQVMETGIAFAPQYLFLSWALHLGSIFLAAAIWGHMLSKLGVAAGFSFNVRVYGVSMLARKVPGAIWYALSRLAMYRHAGWPSRPVVAALAVELVTLSVAGLVVFVAGVAFGLSQYAGISRYVPGPLLLAGMVMAVGVVIWLQPILVRKFMERRVDQTASIQAQQRIGMGDTALWIAGTAGVLASGAGMIDLLLLAMDAHVPYVVVLSGFALAVALGPIAIWMPADIGLKDGILYLVMTPFLTEPIAALAVLLIRLWITLLEIAFGLICALTFGKPMLQEVFQREQNRT